MATAKASPRKRFFIEMFTRDISLSDSILDLIDNSIDSLIRIRRIDLGKTLLESRDTSTTVPTKLPQIHLDVTRNKVSIRDNCGGLGYSAARDEAFNFGHAYGYEDPDSQLGVYGIGLKRAIFKMGDKFMMESHSLKDGFSIGMNSLKEWVQKDTELEDWTFPIRKLDKAKNQTSAGTKLVVSELHKEVQSEIEEPTFENRLRPEIAIAYSLFLNRYASVFLNGKVVNPITIPFGKSEGIEPGYKILQEDGVNVHIYAAVAERTSWEKEISGWYVACNGRLVVFANKDELTGWGTALFPEWHTKYRGFVGFTLFQSSDPYRLPWTTTKRGLNRESAVYQKARLEMQMAARPVLRFFNNMYPSEPAEQNYERKLADSTRLADISEITSAGEREFMVAPKPRSRKPDQVSIQYKVTRSDIEKIQKNLADPSLTAKEIGIRSFDAFLKLTSENSSE